MRPPTRNDGQVPALHKHLSQQAATSPPAAAVAAATTAAPVHQLSQSLHLNGGVHDTTRGKSSSKGRRAFFNVESDHLLCYASAEAAVTTAAILVPNSSVTATVLNIVPFDRRHSDCLDAGDASPQVAVPRLAAFNGTQPTVIMSSSEDSSSSAHNSSVSHATATDSNSNSSNSSSTCSDRVSDQLSNPKITSDSPATSVRREIVETGRVALVKNSASLIFTKKKVPPQIQTQKLASASGNVSVSVSHPAVHRRLRSIRSTAENRRSLHEQLAKRPETHSPAVRSERAYSWYAPLYTPLREEGEYRLLQNSSPTPHPRTGDNQHLTRSLASSAHAGEASALLDTVDDILPTGTPKHIGRNSGAIPPSTLDLMYHHTPQSTPVPPAAATTMPTPALPPLHSLHAERLHAGIMRSHYSMSPHGGGESDAMPTAQTHDTFSVGAPPAHEVLATPAAAAPPVTKYSRFEQLIKSLVGRGSKVSRADSSNNGTPTPVQLHANITANSTPTSTAATADIALTSSLRTPPSPDTTAAGRLLLMPPSPEIRITKSPSEYSLICGVDVDASGVRGDRSSGFSVDRAAHRSSTASLNAAVQQKLWSVVPLLSSAARRDAAGSCASLAAAASHGGGLAATRGVGNVIGGSSGSGGDCALMKKCDTVLVLSRSASSHMQSVLPAGGGGQAQVRPLNRLRHSSSSTITCSRCSSLLSLAANGSRYSLNVSQGGGFVSIAAPGAGCDATDGTSAPSSPLLAPNTPTALRWSRSSLLVGATTAAATTTTTTVTGTQMPSYTAMCKLCLGEVHSSKLSIIVHCGCVFCTECMRAYVEFEILEGAYEISCPDALCAAQGALNTAEIAQLTSSSLLDKHQRYRLNREVDLDRTRTWCPKAGCDTVCRVTTADPVAVSKGGHVVVVQPAPSSPNAVGGSGGNALAGTPCLVHCPTCAEQFCSGCKKTWHATMSCEENTRRLAAEGQSENIGIPFDNDLIKCCPTCSVPIEKDEGCAQMMCKRCKHVFCWYCLASLDDDFLLRHYDRGPCKNKLGHSRASVVWHRAQVIGIFAGFGILLLVASPLLLLAAPCIVCCKCRICSGAAKLEESSGDVDFEEISALNR